MDGQLHGSVGGNETTNTEISTSLFDSSVRCADHTCARHLIWLYENRPSNFEERRSETAYYSQEGIPECMPEEYRRPSIVDAYQLYYMMDKMSFARYKILEPSK